MEQDFRKMDSAGFLGVLAGNSLDMEKSMASCRKNFEILPKNYKKVLCKGKKMGYNKVESVWGNTQKGWRFFR